MDDSAAIFVVKIIDEKFQAIKLSSQNIITIDQIKTKYQNEHELTEEEIKNILFWYEDEDGDKCYIQDNEDIESYVKEISPNYSLLILYSEILKERKVNVNDNIQNIKPLGDISNNEKNINNKKIVNNLDENEIEMKEIKYKENKSKKILNVKDEFIETFQTEISILKKENKKSVEFQKNNNQINNGNYNEKEIKNENIISQLYEKNYLEEIFKKFDKLESSILNKLGDILQKINTNTAILVDAVNKINKSIINENKSNKSKNNTRIINEKYIKEDKNNEGHIDENIINKNFINENTINENKISENKINENIINENIINENNNVIKIDGSKNKISNKKKLTKQIFQRKDLESINISMKNIFFNKDGTVNSKPFDRESFQDKFKKIYKELQNFNIDPIEYFPLYKFYILDPIINNPKIKAEEKKILNEKINLIWLKISNIINKDK